MSQLVPCPSCSRHVRLSSGVCPFCQATFDVAALDARYAPRRGGAQAGVKRAIVFAMGATFAAACGEEVSDSVPIYGAPVAPNTHEQDSSESGPGQSTAPPGDTINQPLYGAPAPSTEDDTGLQSGSTQSVSPEDAGAEQPTADAGVSDAGAGDTLAEAGLDTLAPDGATFDAGPDASLDVETEPTSVALYGGPPLSN